MGRGNKILTDHQHGLRKRSCEILLAVALDRRQQADVILLDFSKAFDKVPHDRLAVKLYHYEYSSVV